MRAESHDVGGCFEQVRIRLVGPECAGKHRQLTIGPVRVESVGRNFEGTSKRPISRHGGDREMGSDRPGPYLHLSTATKRVRLIVAKTNSAAELDHLSLLVGRT